MARHKIEWTDKEYTQIENLASIMCTQAEICSVMNVDEETLCRLIKKRYNTANFSEFFKKFCGKGKASLRRKQFNVALDGNPTMLVWLGKQYLGQTDKIESFDEPVNEVKIVVEQGKDE